MDILGYTSDSTMRCHHEESATSIGEFEKTKRLSIRFGIVKVRDYEQIVSDNPAVRNGVPIGIGWNFVEFNDIMVDDYESHRGQRRTRDQMLLSADERKRILLREWNFSQREIQGAIQSANKVKLQRISSLKKENSVFAFNVWKGLDLLSECAVPIFDIWRKNNECKCDFIEDIPEQSQKCLLDHTKHKQNISIDEF